MMLSKNDIIDAEITAYGSEGEGIAKIDGYPVFVPYTAVGDRIKLKILKAGKSFAFGKAEEIIVPSPDRGGDLCPVFTKCGGCSIMHLKYDAQLSLKRQKVVDALERIGSFRGIEVSEICGMENPVNYRNKIQVPVSGEGGKIIAGFYAPRSHRPVACTGCTLQHPENEKYLNAVLRWMEKYKIQPYDEQTHTGTVRHIYTRIGFKTGEVMVSVIANAKKLPFADELCEILKEIKSEKLILKSVMHNINTEKTNVVLGEKSKVLYGREFIYDYLDNLKFKISHNSFYQVNPVMTEKLYKKAVDLLGDVSDKRVFDIYCGIGTVTLFVARRAKSVIGVEYVKSAVIDAKENAKENNITNTTFYQGDANRLIPDLYRQGITADAVVVDPPRKGLGEELLNTLAKMNPEKIVYISCNAATLARDLKFLCEHGYEIKEVHPFDQFPSTAHVEVIIKMQLVDSKEK